MSGQSEYHMQDGGAFSDALCCWYGKNKRSMPWREDPEPYHVWLSEIMLQQTRIEAAKAYYERFLRRLPAVEDLAGAEEEELMKLWEGLGYYNRARNLQKAARILVESYGGELPADYELLMELPGIGSYTAGAIASIAYGIPAPAVDGNVLRVMMRLLNCRDDISRVQVRRQMERFIMSIMPGDNPGDFNQALMELGEVICIPNGEPACGSCPVAAFCRGREAGHPMELPVKQTKKPRRIEKKTVLVCEDGGKIAVIKRPKKGLLAGMWGFRVLEGYQSISKVRELLEQKGGAYVDVRRLESGKHIFSHVEWHMRGYFVRLTHGSEGILQAESGIVWAEREELLKKYAVPVAYHSFLRQIV